MSGERHRSIGEVLALLQDDFPDVTISKIRFLETQGLITPERTSSGYRKFYEADLTRLRWILTQQKENFLPLKVIKNRLDTGEHDLVDTPPRETQPAMVLPGFETGEASAAGSVTTADPSAPPHSPADADNSPPAPSPPIGDSEVIDVSDRPEEKVVDASSNGSDDAGSALDVDELKPIEKRPARPPGSSPAADPQRFLSQGSSLSMTPAELGSAAGLSFDQVEDLDRFGLIAARTQGGDKIYGEDALLVARLASAFAQHGIEARHLRMYKVAAEREAGVFEQMLMPIARNQAAGRPVVATKLSELASLGDGMRDAMLRQSLSQRLF